MSDIELIHGDITTASVDAIVNAANKIMLGGGGVDGAIHDAAGPALLQACQRVPKQNGIRCPTGEARITEAGRLPAKFVIHTVGPRYHLDENPAALLANAYRNSLELALENNCRSIAFPAISCGAFGYPIAEAAQIAVQTCRLYQDRIRIRFYLFGHDAMGAWQEAQSTKEPRL